MTLMGIMHAMAGLVALINATYYLVGQSGLLVSLNYTAWGWVHIIVGVVVVVAGFAAMTGATWARVVGIGLGGLSVILNIGSRRVPVLGVDHHRAGRPRHLRASGPRPGTEVIVSV